ncbi:MAG: hypothetical protein KJ726_01200 [Verrucomicrobia bacterium]|nr:hypothetical protein [Verrucomicrobiota bacterium]
MRKKFLRALGPILGLLSLYAAGLGIRRAVLAAQVEALGRVPPFTLESALYFRRAEQVFLEGRIPERDADLQYPEGVVAAETDTVGSEYVYAALARLFPASVPLAERFRWLEAGWFCLGIPLMALWIRWRGGSWLGGLAAGGFYAVALSSVIRSTGQELLHENFAIPLLIAHLAFDALASCAETAPRRLAAIVMSAAFLALALVGWDLIQFYVLLWMLAAAFRLLSERKDPVGRWPWLHWAVSFAALMLAGRMNPYLRAHGFLFSPPMLLGYGIVLAGLARTRLPASRSAAVATALLLVAPAAFSWGGGGAYRQSYGHFTDLLAAKMIYLNRKPADPALLGFDARILWVPGLNSATWSLASALFPAMMPLTLFAGAVLFLKKVFRRDPNLVRHFFFFSASLAAFIFFVRFHVLLAVFMAGGLGLAAGVLGAGRRWFRWVGVLLLLAGMGAEAAHTLDRPERWGRGRVYYEELDELTQWMGRHVCPEPVLANFGVSASILAYGHCPVLLHPKFESRAIRDRVRTYGEKLFLGTERELRDWADRLGARYLVFARGEFAPVEPDRQMRYFVNALNPPEHAAARILESTPDQARWFRRVWENRKYRVFRILTRADEGMAWRYGQEARRAFQEGDLARAEERAASALLLDAREETAQEVLKHVGSLRQEGFRADGHEGP